MIRHTSRPRRRAVAAIALAGVTFLAACDEINPGTEAEAGDTAVAAEAGADPGVLRIEERDVERPDIFEGQARGLWDGRFSLGGKWVAVAQTVKADRIRITNLANGRETEGALFSREVNLPGPPFMVSMDAAQALGMQPGTPAELRVVVVRTETVEIPAPAPAPLPDAAVPAVDEAEGELVELTTEPLEHEALDAIRAATAEAIAAAAAAAAEAPAEPAAAAEAAVDGATSEIAAAPLPPIEAPAAPSAASGEAPTNPYLQVASGDNREGADAAVRRIAAAGLNAEVRTAGTEDAPIYRVIVGPFATRPDVTAALAQLQQLGYEGAFGVQ